MENALNKGRSHIYNAILKHGLENFSLENLEYCDSDKCIEREDYYISLLKPSYNIFSAKPAGSSLGFKHSSETRRKMLDSKIDNCQRIKVFDQDTNETITHDSIRAAARVLNISFQAISIYLLEISRNLIKEDIISSKFNLFLQHSRDTVLLNSFTRY
jgi:hypothetical protein